MVVFRVSFLLTRFHVTPFVCRVAGGAVFFPFFFFFPRCQGNPTRPVPHLSLPVSSRVLGFDLALLIHVLGLCLCSGFPSSRSAFSAVMPALGVWGLGVFGAVSAPEGLASEVVTSGVVTPGLWGPGCLDPGLWGPTVAVVQSRSD